MKIDIKTFLTQFLSTISLITIVEYIFVNYENVNFNWWVPPIFYIIISLTNIFINLYKKPLFSITLTGSLMFSFYIVEEMYINLSIDDKFIIFFTKVMVTLILASLTEYIVADISLSNVILDVILGAVTVLIYSIVSIIVEEAYYIPLIKIIIILIYSIMVVMIDNPMKLRKMKED